MQTSHPALLPLRWHARARAAEVRASPRSEGCAWCRTQLSRLVCAAHVALPIPTTQLPVVTAAEGGAFSTTIRALVALATVPAGQPFMEVQVKLLHQQAAQILSGRLWDLFVLCAALYTARHVVALAPVLREQGGLSRYGGALLVASLLWNGTEVAAHAQVHADYHQAT